MQLKPRSLTWLILAISGCAVIMSGCNSGTSLNTVLNQQLTAVLGTVNPQVLRIEVVNQTINDVQLDLTVDGTPQTITCSAFIQVCDLTLTTCPSNITAVQQRSLDSSGRFVGGRNFNGNAAFTFTTGEFKCDSTIVYKFTETDATAFVI